MYKLLRIICKTIVAICFKLEASGISRFPQKGAFVLCSNHTSWWDPVILAALCPREIHFIAKVELFKNPFLNWLFRKLHAFPVNRGKADIRAVREALARLKNGNVLGVFPEGTRNKGDSRVLGKMHGGAALFAIKGQVPIVPVLILGPYEFRKTLKVAVGNPLIVGPGTGKVSRDIEHGSQQVTEALNELFLSFETKGAA